MQTFIIRAIASSSVRCYCYKSSVLDVPFITSAALHFKVVDFSDPDRRGVLQELFLGSFFAALLSGIAFVQILLYFRKHDGDRRLHKLSVVALGAINACAVALNVAGVWHTIGALKTTASHEINRLFELQVGLMGIEFSVQRSLYLYRIWILRDRARKIPMLILGTVMVGWVIDLVFAGTTIALPSIPSQSLFYTISSVAVPLWTAVNDTAIAITLCFYLRRVRVVNTRWVDFVVHWIFSTGILTSLTSWSIIAVMVRNRNEPAATTITLGVILTTLHVNNFLILLNTRPVPKLQLDDNKRGFQGGSDLGSVPPPKV